MPFFNAENINMILNGISDGITIVNEFGELTFINGIASSLENINLVDSINKHISEIYPSLNEYNSTLLKVLKTGEPILNLEQTYTTYLGNEISTLNSTLPLYDRDKIIGAVEISKNITQVKKLSMKLVDLQKVVTGHDERVLTNNTKYSFKDILTNDMSMIKIISKVMRIAQNEAHIVLSGETGTGKELFAHSIHNSSFRKEKPFIAQNCAAIPETLLESILFGTSKGSFTGSVDRPGLLELSNGGTLMLDEINSMPISLQVKLLRVVQDGRFRRLGENKIREVDIRIIAALNEDPFKAIEEGRLRRDLFYRLSTNIVEIPPLRERTLDIEYLSQSFVRIYNDMYKKNIKGFDKRVIDLFQSFGWPGNVRELEHVVQSAVNECEKSLITMEDLPQYIFKSEKKNENTSIEFKSLHEHIKVYENTLIKKVLDDNNWNVSKSAKELGIPRQTLQYKIKEMSAR